MRLRPNGPDIVQMRLPADMTGDAGSTLEFLLDWPTGVAGRLCGLVSTMVDPLNFDVEVAIRTPVDERDARLGAAVLALFGERAPEFSGLRQQLALAEQERAEFQTLTPEAIQGWIREPQDG